MKKILFIITIVIVTAASFIYALTINSEDGRAEQAAQQEKPKKEIKSCCAADSEVSAGHGFTENSIYQVNSSWKNQFGNEVNIGDLKGSTQIITLIFANCSYACPILVNDMRRIEESLGQEALGGVKFTLISIDPERDTPERLKKFAEDQNLNYSRWQLLTGNRSDIDDIAALIGFRYKKENDGSFSHSNIITILNSEGEIVHQQAGLNQDINQTLQVITDLNKKGV